MSGDRQKIDAELLDVDRNFSDRLSGVGVNESTGPPGGRCNLGNRLDSPNLILRVNDRYESCLAVDRRIDVRRINEPVGLSFHPRDFVLFAGLRCRMFDRCGHEIATAPIDPDGAADSDIARLSATAGKNDFVGRGANQRGDLGPSSLLGVACPDAECVGG